MLTHDDQGARNMCVSSMYTLCTPALYTQSMNRAPLSLSLYIRTTYGSHSPMYGYTPPTRPMSINKIKHNNYSTTERTSSESVCNVDKAWLEAKQVPMTSLRGAAYKANMIMHVIKLAWCWASGAHSGNMTVAQCNTNTALDQQCDSIPILEASVSER